MDSDYLDDHNAIFDTHWGAVSIHMEDNELVIFTDEFDVPITIVDPAGKDIVRMPEGR